MYCYQKRTKRRGLTEVGREPGLKGTGERKLHPPFPFPHERGSTVRVPKGFRALGLQGSRAPGLQGSRVKNAGLQDRKIGAPRLYSRAPFRQNQHFVCAPRRKRLWATGSMAKNSRVPGLRGSPFETLNCTFSATYSIILFVLDFSYLTRKWNR